jgi:hypothetical protein
MSCVSPPEYKKSGESPNCHGPQIGAPESTMKWACPFCQAIRYGVETLQARNNRRLEEIRDLLARCRPASGSFDSSRVLTGAGLQRALCDLVEGLLVDLFNDSKSGQAPGHFAFLVCGSLGRREAAAFSDIDALLVLQNDDPETVKYYKLAAAQMNSRLMFAGGAMTGFRFCPGGLTPMNLLGTSEAIFEYIDARPDDSHLHNALQSRFIFGTKAIAEDFFDKVHLRRQAQGKANPDLAIRNLREILAKKNVSWMDDEQNGWAPPARDPVAVQVKVQFYRPVSMVVEELRRFYGLEPGGTRDMVIQLIKTGHMSVEVGNFLFNILDDLARVRTVAHAGAGSEFEMIKLRAVKPSDHFPSAGLKEDIDRHPVADRQTVGQVLALVERVNRFWRMVETFVSEKAKRFAVSRTNPFKSKRP